MVPEEVVGETDSRLPYGGVVVVEAGFLESPAEPGDIELADARWINETIARRTRKFRVRVSDVAEGVVRSSIEVLAKAEIQSQGLRHTVVVLCEERVGGNPVIMIRHAAAALGNQRRAQHEVLKIREIAVSARNEIEQAVIEHRQVTTQGDAIGFPAEPERVRSMSPAHGVNESK